MYQRTRADWIRNIDFLAWDVLFLVISFCLAYLIRYGIGFPFGTSEYRTLFIVMLFAEITASLLLNNLKEVLRRPFLTEAVSIAVLSFVALALMTLYLFSAHNADRYSRLLVYYTIVLFSVITLMGRTVRKKIIIRKHQTGELQGNKSLLIVTEAASAEKVIADLKKDVASPYHLKGLVLTDSASGEVDGVPVVCDIEGAGDYICREWVDEVLFAFREMNAAPESLLSQCAEMGVTVHTILNLTNVDRNKQFIEEIGNRTVLTTAFNYIAPYQAFIKRTVDIIGGLVGSVFALLIALVIGPIIYIKSPGPILFRQNRIGRNGKVFKMLKFRSMYPDAEERKKEFLEQNRVSDGMMFKLDFDPRIIGNEILPDGTRKTGIGEFIRKTSLDEFPQFFNVLKGDMSLVGTRPPTLDEWEKYQYHHRARLAIKPGITGMWQVSGRSDITDFEEVVKLDTMYICNFRLSLDIKILFKTVFAIFKRKGAM